MTYVPKTNIVTKPKTPAALAKLKGTYQPCRHKDDVADSKALEFVHDTLPQPPEDLSDKAKEYWIKQLSSARKVYGYISFIDLAIFEELCKVYAEPYYVLLQQTRDIFLKLSREFGFTPSARTRITLQNKPDENTDIYGDGI
jgi:phage terminase small subunit